MKPFLGEPHPNQIVYYDPGLASQNIGDEIISDSARRQLDPLFPGCFPFRVSSHQKMSFRYRRFLYGSKYGFLLGSNILKGSMLLGYRQWDVSLVDTLQVKGVVMVGCGWHVYEGRMDAYSKALFGRILSHDVLHSVRDEYTKQKLGEVGFANVLNTGCATMWSLTPAFCERIPSRRAPRAVATITDYNQDPRRDDQMLSTLLSRYDDVSLWLQGNGDRAYAETLPSFRSCKVIPSTLGAYDAFLDANDIDYVGTRLHGGIRALQHGRKSLVIAIDNRAREKSRDFNIPALERDDMDGLEDWIFSSSPTEISIPEREIRTFLDQFKL